MKIQRLNRYLYLPLVIAALLLSAFTIQDRSERVKGSGSIKEETRTADAFKSISTSGSFNIYIQQGSAHDIKIETDDNLLPYIITNVKGQNLEVYVKKGYNIKPSKTVNVYVTMEQLEGLSSSGSGGFYSKGQLKGNKVNLAFSGSTVADLDLNADAIKVGISGSSNVKLKGNIAVANYGISGSGDIAAFDLQSDDVHIGVSGSGKVNVYAKKKLDIGVSGMGNIRYKGDPAITQSSSGMSKVTKED